MILGRSIIQWIVLIVVAICIFILSRWAIPLLFGVVGVAIPDQIATILALLIALGVFYGWGWRAGPVV